MAENQTPEKIPAQPQVEQAPADKALSELQKNPDALKDLAKNPDFLRTLDALKSNPAVKEALDKAWNAALADNVAVRAAPKRIEAPGLDAPAPRRAGRAGKSRRARV